MPGDPRLTGDRRDDARRARRSASPRRARPVKTVPRIPSWRKSSPIAEPAAGVERRHPGGRPRPARRPVDRAGPGRRPLPVERPRRDRDDVPHRVRRVVGRPGQLADRDPGEPRLLRMDDRQLIGRGGLDHLGDPDDVGALVGGEPKPERLRRGDDVEHPAVRDVDRDGAQVRDLDRRVEVGREGRHVPERHAGDLAVAARRPDPDQAGRRLERQLGHGLDHRQHAGLEQRGHDADRVRAAHPGYSTCSMIT